MVISARAHDSRLAKMLREFADWLNVRDYDRATEEATDRIVKKQSRGSVFAQNGWYMTKEELLKSSRKADSDVDALRAKLVKNNS
jgi:hypothetical protein